MSLMVQCHSITLLLGFLSQSFHLYPIERSSKATGHDFCYPERHPTGLGFKPQP